MQNLGVVKKMKLAEEGILRGFIVLGGWIGLEANSGGQECIYVCMYFCINFILAHIFSTSAFEIIHFLISVLYVKNQCQENYFYEGDACFIKVQ